MDRARPCNRSTTAGVGRTRRWQPKRIECEQMAVKLHFAFRQAWKSSHGKNGKGGREQVQRSTASPRPIGGGTDWARTDLISGSYDDLLSDSRHRQCKWTNSPLPMYHPRSAIDRNMRLLTLVQPREPVEVRERLDFR